MVYSASQSSAWRCAGVSDPLAIPPCCLENLSGRDAVMKNGAAEQEMRDTFEQLYKLHNIYQALF